MISEFWMMLIIAVGYLLGIIILGMNNGLHHFNPMYLVAGHTAVIMVVSVYAAMWFLRMCAALESLLRILTGCDTDEAHPSLKGTLRHLYRIYEELGKS